MVIKDTKTGHFVQVAGLEPKYVQHQKDAQVYKPRGAKIQATKLSGSTGVPHVTVE